MFTDAYYCGIRSHSIVDRELRTIHIWFGSLTVSEMCLLFLQYGDRLQLGFEKNDFFQHLEMLIIDFLISIQNFDLMSYAIPGYGFFNEYEVYLTRLGHR